MPSPCKVCLQRQKLCSFWLCRLQRFNKKHRFNSHVGWAKHSMKKHVDAKLPRPHLIPSYNQAPREEADTQQYRCNNNMPTYAGGGHRGYQAPHELIHVHDTQQYPSSHQAYGPFYQAHPDFPGETRPCDLGLHARNDYLTCECCGKCGHHITECRYKRKEETRILQDRKGSTKSSG